MYTEAQLGLRELPSQPHVMYQRWRSLLFLHFPCPPEEIEPLLPPGLSVDTFPDESGRLMAWVGLVPFRMERIRPRFLPPVKELSAFPETNVRTYVHRQGRDPGVWFFSLDAANGIACAIARRFFGLPYFHANMHLFEEGDVRRYVNYRYSAPDSLTQIWAEFGPFLPTTEPGTLEFFLIERYLLYAMRQGRLMAGRVHHHPYRLREASVHAIDEKLVTLSGIRPRPFDHVLASDGVDVKIYPLEPT